MPDRKIMTIDRHILEQQRQFPEATGEFSDLLVNIALAAKLIGREVSKAGLVNILGLTDAVNVYGERLKKLDLFAHETFVQTLQYGGDVCVMASEESETIIEVPQRLCGKYVLLFDPLDGSSNIEANVSIGSIFSVYRKVTPGVQGAEADCLQKGTEQVAAGYVIYGSSTMFVYTTGQGVHGFTYDPSIGEFLLSHEHIQIPARGRIYSINEGNYHLWSDGVRKYIDYLKTPDQKTHRPYSLRYIGSLVADFHRNLLYGGIFLYPGDERNPRGKLRLLYEANPLAFIVEQAGGAASDGHRRILDIQPQSLHDRTPLIIGSREDVGTAEAFIRGQQNIPESG